LDVVSRQRFGVITFDGQSFATEISYAEETQSAQVKKNKRCGRLTVEWALEAMQDDGPATRFLKKWTS
jgi:hypothetical protein